MKFANSCFIYRYFFSHYLINCLREIGCLVHLTDRLATDSDTVLDHELGLSECKCISFDRIGIVYLHHAKTLLEFAELSY